jgi:hypothetical protein
MTHSWRQLTFAALAVSIGLAAGCVPLNPPDTVAPGERDDFLPLGKMTSLPGTTVGVLVSDVKDVMYLDRRGSDPANYGFARGLNSYRWIDVPGPDDWRDVYPASVPVGEKGDTIKGFDRVTAARAETVKQFGITAPYALVEVEVNGGQGSPADAFGHAFVATKMRQVDGTRDYPLNVAEAVASLRQRFERESESDKALSDALEKARRLALGNRPPTGPRETDVLLYLTWLPETQRLRVAFRAKVTDAAYVNPDGADLDRPRTDRDEVPRGEPRHGTQFGIIHGTAYEVDKTGGVVRVVKLPPENFERKIPSPDQRKREREEQRKLSKDHYPKDRDD